METDEETQEETVEVNGVKIFFVRIGRGPHVLFFMPGPIGTGRTDFCPFVNLFDKEKYTMILWDPIGRGKSYFPDDRHFIFNNEFRDIEARAAGDLMEKLGINRYSLIGSCYGGQVALRVAAARKECVNKVVMWGTHAWLTNDLCHLIGNFMLRFVAGEIKSITAEKLRAIGVESNCGEKRYRRLGSAAAEGYNETLVENEGYISRDILPHIEAEVLLVHGDEDEICPLEHAEYHVKNLKKAKLHRIADGGHYLPAQSAEELHKVIDEFMLSTD